MTYTSATCAKVLPGEKHPDCASCPFAKDGIPINTPVRPDLADGKAVGVLVGEGPGFDEHAMGRPFVGKTGEQLDRELAKVGLARDKIHVINAMGCMPPQGMRTDSNMRQAATACRSWMLGILRGSTEIRTPTLAMGKWAGYLITGKARAIKPRRGFLRYENKRFTPLVLTWHPTYAMFRNPWVEGEFLTDLDRFARATRGELQPLPKTVIKPTIQQIRALFKEPFVTVDIETGARTPDRPWTGKDPTQATLKVIGLGTPKVGYSMWWADQPLKITRAVRQLLESPKVRKVLQNGYWFDLRVILRRLGWKIRNVRDTRDMRRAISTTSLLSLGFMSSIYLDVPDWKAKAEDGKE